MVGVVTNFARPNKDDYPGAAKKHLDDADALLKAGRFDGAGYLLGYVIECSLRTVVMLGEIAERGGIPQNNLKRELVANSATMRRLAPAASREASSKGRGHDLDALVDATSGYHAVLNSSTVRYAPPIDKSKPPISGVGSWTHSIRYRAEGDISDAIATEWLQAAEKVYLDTIGLMIRDGLIQK